MADQQTRPIVYFDGSCALCRAEIAHYRHKNHAETLCFVDISRSETDLATDLTRQQAMERFHVRAADGQLLSGAAAFVEIWNVLPGWSWAARLARFPKILAGLEYGYKMFLPIRPFISRIFGRMQGRFGHNDVEPTQ